MGVGSVKPARAMSRNRGADKPKASNPDISSMDIEGFLNLKGLAKRVVRKTRETEGWSQFQRKSDREAIAGL
jgi:hypothetical protein